MPTPEQIEPGDERRERQLAELLGELRVAMPGVQLLFAFLLVVPFNQRFGETTDFQRAVYLGVVVCAARQGADAPTATALPASGLLMPCVPPGAERRIS